MNIGRHWAKPVVKGDKRAMALAVISSDRTPDVGRALDQLQLEQFEHDEKYHREIARLPVQNRLTHMALHFAKYAGNLAEAGDDQARVQRIVTDVFVIGVSSANILNLRLSEALAANAQPSRGLSEFAVALAVCAGRMAAACEKLDHLEDFPFRPVIRDAVVELVRAAILAAENRRWNLPLLVRTRLKGVKEKSIFHGRA